MLPFVRNNPGLAVFSERGCGRGIPLPSAVSDYTFLVFGCNPLWPRDSQEQMVRICSDNRCRFAGSHQYSSSDRGLTQPRLKQMLAGLYAPTLFKENIPLCEKVTEQVKVY